MWCTVFAGSMMLVLLAALSWLSLTTHTTAGKTVQLWSS